MALQWNVSRSFGLSAGIEMVAKGFFVLIVYKSYDKETKTGGSNGATMRFAPEGDHGANAGLKAARDFMEPVKGKPNPQSLPHPQPS